MHCCRCHRCRANGVAVTLLDRGCASFHTWIKCPAVGMHRCTAHVSSCKPARQCHQAAHKWTTCSTASFADHEQDCWCGLINQSFSLCACTRQLEQLSKTMVTNSQCTQAQRQYPAVHACVVFSHTCACATGHILHSHWYWAEIVTLKPWQM